MAEPCHDAWHTVPCPLRISHLLDTGDSTDEPHRPSSSRGGRGALLRASVDGRAAALGPAAPVPRRNPGSPGAASRLPAATALPGQPAGRERAGLQAAGTRAWGGRPGEPCSRAGLSCLPCFQPRCRDWHRALTTRARAKRSARRVDAAAPARPHTGSGAGWPGRWPHAPELCGCRAKGWECPAAAPVPCFPLNT